MPVFGFFNSFVGSLGIVIALLTIFYSLVNFSSVYTSYLSGAKMKALRPEIDKLKAKLGNDQQQIGVETDETFSAKRCKSIGWMYSGIVADSHFLCVV